MNELVEDQEISGSCRRASLLEPLQKFGTADDAQTEHLSDAGEEVLLCQCGEKTGVKQDPSGCGKDSHQILGAVKVEAALGPDTAIRLGEHRRGHIGPRHTPLVDTAGKRTDVLHDATAD